MEEKEKEECTGRGRCGAHAHSLTLTLSERVSLAHTHAGAPEHAGSRAPPKSCFGFRFATSCIGKCISSVAPPSCGILSSRLRTSGTPAAAASASGTVGSLEDNSGGCPQRGAQSRCPRASGDPSRSPPLGRAASVVPACNANARELLLFCPLCGSSPAPSANSILRAGISRGAGAAPSRADPGTYKAGTVPA